MAAVPGEIFKTYDIRGIVGRTLTPAIVELALAQTLALRRDASAVGALSGAAGTGPLEGRLAAVQAGARRQPWLHRRDSIPEAAFQRCGGTHGTDEVTAASSTMRGASSRRTCASTPRSRCARPPPPCRCPPCRDAGGRPGRRRWPRPGTRCGRPPAWRPE